VSASRRQHPVGSTRVQMTFGWVFSARAEQDDREPGAVSSGGDGGLISGLLAVMMEAQEGPWDPASRTWIKPTWMA
jgi:hypothetical protein